MNRFTIRVIPNASRSESRGMKLGVWHIRIAAPAVDGEANEALIEFLADHFDCAKSRIRITKGQTNKTKVVEIS